MSKQCTTLLAWLKRHREKQGPRAIRFELNDGKAPRLVLEPWNVTSRQSINHISGARDGTGPHLGHVAGLLSLARLLPLASEIDVYLLGNGLPSFWVVQMGNMRLTLGLSGWTTNDWTRAAAPFKCCCRPLSLMSHRSRWPQNNSACREACGTRRTEYDTALFNGCGRSQS